MEPLRRFRLICVRVSLIITALAGFGLYKFYPQMAKGVLLGGIGGVLVFWLFAVSLERVANGAEPQLRSHAYRWTFLRLIVYGLVLLKAYTLDTRSLLGLFGAAGGLLIVRAVALVLGLTGLDLEKQEETEKS